MNTPFYRAPIKEAFPKVDNNLIWVYFTDKGFRSVSEYENILQNYSPPLSVDALERRLNFMGQSLDFDDLPVYQKYIDEIIGLGAELRGISNWLNAASFRISSLQILEKIFNLPFVYNITPLRTNSVEILDRISISQTDKNAKKRKEDTTSYRVFYGLAYDQNAMLGVPPVFHRGYSGSRVKLAIFDTGLKRKHNAVRNLKIYKEHDFLAPDDFYKQDISGSISKIDNLSNISLIKSPQLIKTNQNRLLLIYSADSFRYSTQHRGVFYSYSNNQGQTWSNAKNIYFTPTHNISIQTISYALNGSKTFLAWQDLLPQAPTLPIPRIYFGYFVDTTWNSLSAPILTGKNPNIFAKNNYLYLVYTNPDSILLFDKSYTSNLQFTNPIAVNIFNEPIINPLIIVDSVVNIFAIGVKSHRIYQFQSFDNGFTFQPLPFVDTTASAIQVQSLGDTIYLLYKDYTSIPYTKLSLKKSIDQGNTWSTKIAVTDNLTTLGDFAFILSGDTIFITYESQGNIYLTKSTDFGNTFSPSYIITQDFSYCPRISIFNNQPFILWYKHGDENTDYEQGEDHIEQPNHGTRMASIIAGYQPNSMVGVAPGAELLIAKTELYRAKTGDTVEITSEEDNWIQALEWAEKEGAKIISSSLGYRNWYIDRDLDGKTIPISIAAGIAAKRGVVIVSAMGNRTSAFPWPSRYIVAPGDAIGIITAGGITKSLRPWRGTGLGPTIDGRTKPDLVALADTVIVVAPDSTNNIYEGSIGTSCATALIAGCCALICEAHPEWNADSVKNALFATATHLGESIPNDTFGYGVPNIDSLLKLYPPKRPEYQKDRMAEPFPNPYIPSKHGNIYFPLLLMNKPVNPQIRIYTLNGELVKTLKLNPDYLKSLGRYGVEGDKTELEKIGAFWNGKNESGRQVGAGLYFAVLQTSWGYDVTKFAVIR
ncbi:MAG: S8 family serine peptidase [candidate division WOR-3 bacterium]|nr:S8 family serine peptidase [candidate division WOR-3 bacterium]